MPKQAAHSKSIREHEAESRPDAAGGRVGTGQQDEVGPHDEGGQHDEGGEGRQKQSPNPRDKKTNSRNLGLEKRYLGWEQPPLHTVVDILFAEHAEHERCDLRALTIFLPGSLACRRLKELLALRAEREALYLHPPQILTIGCLPEQLYVSKLPFANPSVQQVAWMQALLDTPKRELQQVVSVPPPKAQALAWLELGNNLARVHRDLASEGLDFGKVLEQLSPEHPEYSRWHTLQSIQGRYLAKLHELKLWDIQTARLCALERNETATNQNLLIVGCVDLNETQRAFLASVAKNVELWVLAPETAGSGFDEFGCVIADFWTANKLDIPSERLLVTNSPSDQAELVAGCLADFGERFHLSDVTLSVPDTNFVAEFRRRLDLAGLKTRYGPGQKLLQTEPIKLLSSIAGYLEGRSYQAFATLIRQPAVEQFLLREGTIVESQAWLAEIDKYYQSAIPKRIDNSVDVDAPGSATFLRVRKAVHRWLSTLSQKPAKLASFVEPMLGVLATAYEQQSCDLGDPEQASLYSAAELTCQSLLALRDIPAEAQPTLTASEVISWLLVNLVEQRVAEEASEDSLEIIGWLDLLLDDSSAVIVAGIHDDVLPGSLNSDAFLPNSLRQKLGMMDNKQRLARDLFAARVLLESREDVRFVAGKTDHAGDPLLPSRLLTSGSLECLPARVLHLVSDEYSDRLEPVSHRWQVRATESAKQLSTDETLKGLTVPKPSSEASPQQITVTAFRDYLQCPYRFYLRHIRRLRPAEDTSTELDASQFGNLIHDTLALLDGPIAASADADEIEEFLVESMREIASKRYGRSPSASILIQLEQAEMRLAAFAEHQAEQAKLGWRTKFLERGVDAVDGVLVGGSSHPLNLVGRIDRIDFHEETGQWAIWDYKTSENAKDPVAAHWNKKDGWVDLQLPLYIRIAEHLGVTGNPSLGYINVPKQASNIGFQPAKFTKQQLDDAMRVADEIADKVAGGEFWPLQNERVVFDDFARVCQTRSQRIEATPPAVHPHRTTESKCEFDAKTLLDASRIAEKPMVEAINLPPTLIRASAGTGKTFQLTNRLLQILLTGQSVDSILATTFTRKAAGEIMRRVMERLASACMESRSLAQLREHLPGVHVSQANCLAALRRLTMSVHRFRVCTLDSFFAQVARAFSFEMSLPQGWSPLDPAREMPFQLNAIGHVLEHHDRKTLLDLVRMLAKGESSRRISEEISRTVNAGYPAFRVTTEEDWNQLKVDPAPSEAALESALRRLNETKLGHAGADKHLQKLHLAARTGDWEAVIAHGIYSRLDSDPITYFSKELPNELVLALRLIEERAAAELLTIRCKQTGASYKVLAAYDRAYAAQLRQTRLLAFSDVTHYLAQWLVGDNSTSSISRVDKDPGQRRAKPAEDALVRERLEFRLDCGVRHLLLDEFQDTAPQQWQILEPLAKPLARSEDPQQSFFVVGDTKQAIYGWRGGVAEVFDAVVDTLPGISQQELRHSYRSSQEVLDAVNEVFLNLPRHPNYGEHPGVAAHWSKNFPTHTSMLNDAQDKAGFVQLQNGPKVDSSKDAEAKRMAFLDFSASQIDELCRCSSASIGVLLRTNTQVAEMIALLQARGISASQDGGNPLTDSSAVELLLSAIHLADHPGDTISLFHVSNSPIAEKFPPFDAGQFSTWMRSQVSRYGLGNTLEQLAELIFASLSWWDQNRVEQLIRMAHEFDISDAGRLRDFERSVESRRVALPTEAQVQVMTIHKSKGLEFDAVFLPDLQIDLQDGNSLLVLRGEDPCKPPTGVLRYMNASLQRSLPGSWQAAFAQHKQRQMNESLCLLYVAMTRAKHGLYMVSKPTSRSASQQLGAILQSTLAEAEVRQAPEATLYQRGDPNWMARFPKVKSEQGPVEQAPARNIALRTDLKSTVSRRLRVATPSHVLPDKTEIRLSQAFAAEQTTGTIYGRLIHAFFQQVRWLEDFQVESEKLTEVARRTVEADLLQRVSIERAIDEFTAMLELNSVRQCLSRSRYKGRIKAALPDRIEIENEYPISGLMNGELISGTIDRLVVLYRQGQPLAAEIFDFKTDAFDPKLNLLWVDERVQHHRPQLSTYANYMAHALHLDAAQVAAHLLLLSSDDCVRIEPLVPKPHYTPSESLSTR